MTRRETVKILRIARLAASGALACAVLTGVIGLDEVKQVIASALGFGGVLAWKLSHFA